MAFCLRTFELFHKLVISMNLLITCAMAYGFYRFLSQDGIFSGWEWTYYLPIYFFLFVGIPILMCIALLKNSLIILQAIFFVINLLVTAFLLGSIFVDKGAISSPNLHLSWRSYSQLCLALAVPFLVNALTLSLLLIQRRIAHRP